MELLYQHIAEYFEIPTKDWQLIVPLLEEIQLKKNQILTVQKQKEDAIYFVLEGAFRFYIELPEKDVTFDFAFPNQFISSYTSFLTNQPSECQIQALTPALLIKISKHNLNKIYENTTWGESLSRIIAEELFMKKSKRETDLLTLSAEERYYLLFKENPMLIQQIPQKYLASYIGITPQALSRIRKRIN